MAKIIRLYLENAAAGIWKAEAAEAYFVELDHPHHDFPNDLLVAACTPKGTRIKYPQFWAILQVSGADYMTAEMLDYFRPDKKCRNAEDTGRHSRRQAAPRLGVVTPLPAVETEPVIYRFSHRDRTQTHRSDYRAIHSGY